MGSFRPGSQTGFLNFCGSHFGKVSASFFFAFSTYVFGTQVFGDVCAVLGTIAVGQLAFAGVATLSQVLRGFSDG